MASTNARYVNASGAYITQARRDQYNQFYMNNPENEAFEALKRASVAHAQYNSRHRSCPPCDPGTRTDILNNIFDWIRTTEAGADSICWIYGIAGSGKSAIAQSVSKQLAENQTLAASFFFNRLERERSRKEYFITTIAYQLALSIPALKHPICDVITKDETILNAVIADQLLKLIIEPLQSLHDSDNLDSDDSSMVMVIDGLDECEDFIEMAQLITKLADPSSNPRLLLRFLVTSRPEPTIRTAFNNQGIIPTILHLGLQDFRADADIYSFLQRRLRDIPRLRSDVMSEISLPWPSNGHLAALVEKSAGLFIYASTLAMFIEDRAALPHKRLETALANDRTWGHTDLDRLYIQILSVSPNVDHLILLIGAIILVRMPLSPRGLSYLLGLDLGSLQLVLESLHSILSIPENPDTGVVTPYHLSFHDFLVSKDRAGRYFIDPSQTHAQLAKLCLKRISTLPRFTYLTFNHNLIRCWSAVVEHLRQADTTNRTTTQYACRFWASHFSASSRKDLITNDVMAFCRYYVLPWRMFMEIEAQQNNIIQSQDTHVHDLYARAEAARAARSASAWKAVWYSATVLLMLFGTSLVMYSGGVIAMLMSVPISMALKQNDVSVLQKEIQICVMETQLSIAEMPFLRRCMFYRAFTPKVTHILEKAMGQDEVKPDLARTRPAAGESRV